MEKKWHQLWTSLIVIVFGFVVLILAVSDNLFFKSSSEGQVCFRDNCFYVELAQTSEEQARGLMFEKNLKADAGMLFVFQEEKEHFFWMKDTLIPLDIVWLDKNKRVVFISKDNQPCKIEKCPLISPGKNAKYVLEVNAGTLDKIGLRLSEEAVFKIN